MTRTVTIPTYGQSLAPALPRSTPPPLPRSDNYPSSSHTPHDPDLITGEGKPGHHSKNMEEDEEEEEGTEEDKELGGPEALEVNPDDYKDNYMAYMSHHPTGTNHF
ncbi:hypothetical protein FS749_015910 [Ceratobasidium sp. UAMH 11750]|nr:hypothetical protein FS749_015910 [Ceratobasidium sp. UAMH 11750]